MVSPNVPKLPSEYVINKYGTLAAEPLWEAKLQYSRENLSSIPSHLKSK